MKKRNLKWQLRKYQRWCRQYLLRVRMAERQMECEIEPC